MSQPENKHRPVRYKEFASSLIHAAGISRDKHTGAVTLPIYFSSTFRQAQPAEFENWEYIRSGNPTRDAIEELIAELEGGITGLAFSSGMAALHAICGLFKQGERIIIGTSVYGGTFRLLDRVMSNFGITYTQVDTQDLSAVEAAISPDVAAIFVESPTNPLLTTCNLREIAKITQKHGIISVADNTIMTPYLQKPLKLGFDIVVHSASKYLGGHSDLLAGLIAVKNKEIGEKLAYLQNATGAVLAPFDCFLLQRGIKTLAVRMDRHIENATAVAEFLSQNPQVAKIYYPGLPSSPDYETNRLQAKSAGAMLSFELRAGANLRAFFSALEMITLAESLGGVETLICHPAKMTHAAIPPEIRQKTGISDNLIRLSVGIEDKKDILADLERAISAAFDA